jgi:hypothetical protein
MATTIRGIQPLQWGTKTSTGYVIESFTDDGTSGEFIIEDENGDIVTQILGFGEKREITLEVIPKTAITKPAAGDLFTYGTGLSAIALNVINISDKAVKKDVVKWTIKGTIYPNVTPS